MVKRPPARITQASLENAALHYLERFAASRANLERVLIRRIQRAARQQESQPEPAALEWVAQVVEKMIRLGYVDDDRFALARTGTLRARGSSERKIRAHLAQRGIAAAAIDQALADRAQNEQEDELQAAITFARKRRLGPFALRPDRDRNKDLAALARAGFNLDVARQALQNPKDEDFPDHD